MNFSILNLLYPPKCVICGNILEESIQNVEFACKNCKTKLEYYRRDCEFLHGIGSFDALVFSFQYKDVIRKLILDYKFENKKYLYDFFAHELAFRIKKFCLKNTVQIDFIIAVPISFKRYLERGYNQSLLVANKISQILNIPIAKHCLIKYKNNKRQSELSHYERKKNAEGVYKILSNKKINGKNILLIDDIYTTGATVNECSITLKNAGVNYILVATCTRAF